MERKFYQHTLLNILKSYYIEIKNSRVNSCDFITKKTKPSDVF